MQINYKNRGFKRLLLALLVLPLLAVATEQPTKKAHPPDLQPLEEFAPPMISNDEDPDEPQITIVKREGETIEEYRISGQLYMLKITPAHGVPYFLHKEDQDGNWVNMGPNMPIAIPKWIIFRF